MFGFENGGTGTQTMIVIALERSYDVWLQLLSSLENYSLLFVKRIEWENNETNVTVAKGLETLV